MSYKVSLLAYDRSLSDDEIVSELRRTVANIGIDVRFEEAWIRLKECHDLKIAQVLASGLPAGRLASREALMDGFWGKPFATAFIGHDDQHGVYLYSDHAPEPASGVLLVSNGRLVGGSLAKVAVPFAQRGFSPEELTRLSAFDEHKLAACSEAERRAVTEYDNAVTIGLRHRFGWDHGSAYLGVCHEDTGWSVRRGKRERLGPDVSSLFAFFPEESDWAFAKVPARSS